jgi:DNA-binding HxlR family transcriptional regulator
MGLDGARREDPMREIFARLGDKWSMLLMLLLRTGTFRHSVLKRLVNAMGADDEISQRVLTLRLRSLERDGLVARTVTDSVPPRVDYALTPLGHGLLGEVDSLMGWVRRHNDAIRAAQAAFRMAGGDG